MKRSTPMEWVKVAKGGKGFQLGTSVKAFVPWGFNYDRDYKVRLIEDFWEAEWDTVVEHFRNIKTLGANVVRVYFQFSAFMTGPKTPNENALRQLGKLVALAEELGLYLDITGLGCCRKAQVPDWYRDASEAQRWAAQACFWENIARVCAQSPAVFCYDLINEPIVPFKPREPGDWLAGELCGFYYCQFITLDPAGRPRTEIARQWAAQMIAAIRKHDRRHMITIGMLPYTDDGSGFVPSVLARELDFFCVHVYPGTALKVDLTKPEEFISEFDKTRPNDEPLRVLKVFQLGKPVVIEEISQLHCDVAALREMMRLSAQYACGWISFYWGNPLEALRTSKEGSDQWLQALLEVFQDGPPTAA